MKESQWFSEKEASNRLGVTQSKLRLWREVGYLKPGTHWRSSPYEESIPWQPSVIYHLRWCKEVIEYWRNKDSALENIAA